MTNVGVNGFDLYQKIIINGTLLVQQYQMIYRMKHTFLKDYKMN